MDENKAELMDRFVQAVGLHGLNLVNETKNAQGDVQGSSLDFLVPNQTNIEATNYFNHRLQQVHYAENTNNIESRIEPAYQERIINFVAAKADLLFQLKGREELRRGIDYGLDNNHEVLDLFSKVPPLEVFMEIPTHVKRWQLLMVIKEGDIVLGEVTSKRPFGIFVKLTALEFSKNRDFTDTNIEALCRSIDLDDKDSHREYKDPTDAFVIGDYVRGVIISIHLDEERIAVSFKTSKLPEQHQHLHLGLLEDTDGTKESHNSAEGKSYSEHLLNHVGLNNPRNIETLIDILGVDTKPCCSLLRSFQRRNYPEEEYFEVLRKKQSVKWSMESTAKGIELFKAGDINAAMKYLEHALQIDGENVEALVARGALSANEGKYSTAVNYFRQALRINRDHRNAIKYLGQTLIEEGIQQETDDNLTEASLCLNEALDLNPDQSTAKEHLEKVKQLLFLKREKEESSQKNESQDKKSKFSHVRELIEEEQIRKKKKKKKDKKKRKKQRVEKKNKKTRRKSRARSSTVYISSASESSSYESETENSKDTLLQNDANKSRTQDNRTNDFQEQTTTHGDSQASLTKSSSTVKSVDSQVGNRKRHRSRSNSSCSPSVSDEQYSRSRKSLTAALKPRGRRPRYSRSSSSGKGSADGSRRTPDHLRSRKISRRDSRSRTSSRGSYNSRSSSSSDRRSGRSKRSHNYSRSRKSSRRDTRSRSSSRRSDSSRSSSSSNGSAGRSKQSRRKSRSSRQSHRDKRSRSTSRDSNH